MAQTPSDVSMQGPRGADEGKRVTEGGSAELNRNTLNTLHVLEAGSNQLRPQIKRDLRIHQAEGAAHGINCILKTGRRRLETRL